MGVMTAAAGSDDRFLNTQSPVILVLFLSLSIIGLIQAVSTAIFLRYVEFSLSFSVIETILEPFRNKNTNVTAPSAFQNNFL